MTDLTPEHLQELRRIAEVATPGPWDTTRYNGGLRFDGPLRVYAGTDPEYGEPRPIPASDADTRYIAAFDPPTVLAMLDEIEALRAEVEQIAASEKTCRRIANEKTLEAMVLRQQLTTAKAEIETLRGALKDADNELDWLDEEMDTCDHSVGVCTCDYWDMRRKMKAALEKGNSND